ncbi:MAG TPA: HD-GYP domain-containing protein [Candidatus Scatovivens faecipullorum]|nr:HD-GYP domain-containing protein [Candidatus Scatovivens faecipullorum]
MVSTNINNYKIIAVENDNNISHALSKTILASQYSLKKFENLEEAYKVLKIEKFDILILDYSINSEKKFEILKKIRELDEDLYIILVISSRISQVTLKKLKTIVIQGYCEKNDKLNQLPLFIESAIKSIDQMKTIKNINNELLKSKEQLEKAYLESIETLRYTVEAKDNYTRGHSDRVSQYSVLIGLNLGLSPFDLKTLRIGGLFHDIGKIGISDSILLKNGKLTEEEYNEIKKHPIIGKNILSNAEIFKDIIPIVLYHHERYDGKGYPYGLADKDIPLLARIVSVADAFDAMTSKRSYRNELSLDFVKEEIKSKIGTQFDPIVAITFLDILNNEHRLISEIHKSHYFFE